jgi:hypothetical protein
LADKIRWRCSRRVCKGKAVTVGNYAENTEAHSHEKDDSCTQRLTVFSELKKIAQETSYTTQEVYSQVINDKNICNEDLIILKKNLHTE